MRVDSGTDARLIEAANKTASGIFLGVMSHFMIRSWACLRPRPHRRRVRIHQRGPSFFGCQSLGEVCLILVSGRSSSWT